MSPENYCHNCLTISGIWQYAKPEDCICHCHHKTVKTAKQVLDEKWGEIYSQIVELFRFHGVPFDKHSTADRIYKIISDGLGEEK